AVLFQTPVQNFGITPNNLDEMPESVIKFRKEVPTTWDETIFIDGYPGKYVVLARRHGDTWYIAGINAEAKEKTITVSLPMLSAGNVQLHSDGKDRAAQYRTLRLPNNKEMKVSM